MTPINAPPAINPEASKVPFSTRAVFSAAYSDIATYVGQVTLQIILGEEDISIWDEYVANIENILKYLFQKHIVLLFVFICSYFLI